MSDIVLNSAIRNNITAIQRAEEKANKISERLATGNRVNSIIDDPRNFTAASFLKARTDGMNKLLDGIGQNIQAIDMALNGVGAIKNLLEQARIVATQTKEFLKLGEQDPRVEERIVAASPNPLNTLITADNPQAYWRMDGNANNAGSVGGINGIPQNGVGFSGAPLYSNGAGPSAEFNGINQGIRIPDNNAINLQSHPRRTVELVFNADTVSGRQVLYEEGGGVNSFTIYIDNGRLYAVGRDQGAWGPPNISTPINAGQTYHVAFTFDFPGAGEFNVYVDGNNIGSAPVNASFPPHSGDIGIGYSPDGTWYHDGTNGSPNYFDGRISDVALYNAVLTEADFQARANSLISGQSSAFINIDYENLINQIDDIAQDANYRGINLLKNDDMTTYFNEAYTSFLVTEAENFTIEGLGLRDRNFNNLRDVDDIIDRVEAAIERVRKYGDSIIQDLGIIKTRNINLESAIITHKSGAADLTLADMNEEGANMLAAGTRLELSYQALALAADFNNTILQVIGDSPIQ